mmetsp:Transcript_45571/g.114024  ORF Transcript_45571/g.114024 Transcript_45571/m.114024 type:complete len:210 (+) Transcript_45571:1142-1771(+)
MAFMACRGTRGPRDAALASAHYAAARHRVRTLVRNNRRRQRERAVLKAVQDFKKGGGRREFWKWARSLRKGQGSFEGANDQPVRDPVSGVLHTEPGEINACWARHYRELLRDPHPLAQRVAIYRAAWEHRHGTSPPIAPALNGINGHITWEELVKALRRLKNNKAQGQDGITAEALKLAIYAPNSHFGKALLATINGIGTINYIPPATA